MHLVEQMRSLNMSLLDVQWSTPHLSSLGVIEVPRDQYLRQLSEAISSQ
jgi:leucyl/phenylalanyl-tRNA--protein transferase